MTTATVNGLRAVSVRVLTPWSGVWVADVDLDPDAVADAPTSGLATVQIGTSITLIGTVDPRGSGSFVGSTNLRIVGGGGGWDKLVTPQHWHNDSGVFSTLVYQATALQVGESAVDLLPTSLGFDFVRSAGPASRVFGDGPWWVDLSGVTRVGPRPGATADASLEILEWDPVTQRAEVACDALLLPGTRLVDPRLSVSPTVRDVEQIFSHEGSRATAWCSTVDAPRLGGAIKNIVRELGGLDYLKIYRYRFVEERGSSTKLALQAVRRSAGFPDTIPLTVWAGASGVVSKLAPSTECLVEFIDGDPTQPIVRGFSTAATPLEATIDASAVVHLGPSAVAVALAGGGHPIAFADAVLAELVKIGAAIGSLGGTYLAPLSVGSTKASTA